MALSYAPHKDPREPTFNGAVAPKCVSTITPVLALKDVLPMIWAPLRSVVPPLVSVTLPPPFCVMAEPEPRMVLVHLDALSEDALKSSKKMKVLSPLLTALAAVLP